MSYCVHCGVELHDSARACPLCHTPVVDPSKLGAAPPELPPYPTQRAEVPPASKREAALLLTVMLLSVAICCGLLNLFLGRSVPWSAYVIGGAALLWVWVAIPLWFRALPLAVRLILDGVAVGLYVLVIALLADGMVWFKALALPIVLLATAVLLLLGLTLPGRSILSSLSLIFGSIAVFLLGVELCVDRWLTGAWSPGWSIVVLVIAATLCAPLQVVRRVPSLREEVRKLFHL